MARYPCLANALGEDRHAEFRKTLDHGTAHRSRLGADFSFWAFDLLPRRHALRVLGISYQERASADLAGARDAGPQPLAAVAAIPGVGGGDPLHARQIHVGALRPRTVGAAADSPDLRHARDRAAAILSPDRREPRLSRRFRRLLSPPLSGVQLAVLSEPLHRAADLEPSLVRGLSLGLHHGPGRRAVCVAGGCRLDWREAGGRARRAMAAGAAVPAVSQLGGFFSRRSSRRRMRCSATGTITRTMRPRS